MCPTCTLPGCPVGRLVESERDRARGILNRRLHTRTDNYGLHPTFVDSLVDELFPEST